MPISIRLARIVGRLALPALLVAAVLAAIYCPNARQIAESINAAADSLRPNAERWPPPEYPKIRRETDEMIIYYFESDERTSNEVGS